VIPRFSETPGEIRTPAPELGEHTADILRAIGLRDDELAGLRQRKVI
jgi:crotonobetainyl-CoA:carnitine CoA-transferase CaiB-like acyl-CoA transferase